MIAFSDKILETMSKPESVIAFALLGIIVFIGFIVNTIRVKNIRKKYNNLMLKLGNGNNLETMLNSYISKVEDIKKENEEIKEYCNDLNKNLGECLQKIGCVRYSAFQDTGSDLSFALALLDRNNNGAIINGIYSREASNTYAKPVINGESKYTLSKEEEEALSRALEGKIVV